MKAVRIHEFGGPEVLRVEDQPRPDPAPGEVLVRVEAASVNPVDYKMRNGGYIPERALPVTLGRDVAGAIEAVAGETSGFKAGDAVYAMLARDRGGYVEYVAVKAADCARKPERLDFIQAAAVPLAALTAWQGLFDHGRLAAGQRVLIHGASGGVGHFAVQFAKARGATVFATCSQEDVAFVRGLGADEVIDYHAERFEDRAHDIDLVYDLVAGETQDRSWTVLKDGGVMVSTLKEPDKAKAEAKRARGVHYMAQPNGGQLAEIARLIDDGKVTPVIAAVFTLADAAKAERKLENEHVRGKIVLEVARG
ncbi:NADP-dependent oxidoreductase [Phenylobacterium sp.]|uniref:NADP-dependent oxidoreductase n=1 Tax=Phenylobacterium sp. TaxID=1871053 RepID=UPI0012297C97|nr:NADP-dependent oxidoreductase [Phenylobacterium sp.]THD52160.1 MAG: NADP-dependent oxidoreductase [Phenylobacterium sp.]